MRQWTIGITILIVFMMVVLAIVNKAEYNNYDDLRYSYGVGARG